MRARLAPAGLGGVLLLGLLLPPQPASAQAHQLQAWQQQYQRLPASEKQRIQAAWQQYRQLPLEQQQQLRRSFDSQDQLHRDGWRLGPRLGAHWPGLQPLLAYVDPAQREALLQLLYALDEASLQRLTRLAQRTAPEQRQALRDELLQLPPGQRPGWLREQAGS